ncbi:MAG: DUF975 family protein [Clostridiales bacterium]|nr:DUF975 family protein [Clostridiales bacterium]
MTIKDIKAEARKKLALNIHQAIVLYTVEFTVLVTLIALVVMSCVSLGAYTPAAIVMICYGIVLSLIAIVGIGMINFAMSDFYLATYRCIPYNVRRLGDTLARSGTTKILLMSFKRTLFGFLLLLCLIVPGVIYLIRTSMANYLLIANPKMKASTALSASNKVMSGKTGAYFSLCMSLFGWYILCVLTLGLGFIFIMPYTNLVKVVYYKRNLQGDKTVYNTIVQPVSDFPMQQQGQAPQNVGANGAQQSQNAMPVQDGVAPIDSLADYDMVDMNAAMQDFGTPMQSAADVREVPITPVTQSSGTTVTPLDLAVPQASANVADDFSPVTPQPTPVVDETSGHMLEGTSIVETERTLTTQEIDASDAIRQHAIDEMYSPSGGKKPVKDYINIIGNQSPDDFFSADDDFAPVQPQATNQFAPETPQMANAQESAPPISDSDFDDFLKMFDMESAQGKDVPLKKPEREVPHAAENITPERANATERRTPNRATAERRTPDRAATAANLRRETPRRGTEERQQISDRAERIRREREERLNLNNKK